MMQINKSDVIILLQIRDKNGMPLRAKDCERLRIDVFTQNRNNHLTYFKRDIFQDHPHIDRLAIPERDMMTLESGVVKYVARIGTADTDFTHTDGLYDHQVEIMTDIYWRNRHINERPSNPIDFDLICQIRSEIEEERVVRTHDIAEIKEYVENEYTNGLAEQVERIDGLVVKTDSIDEKIETEIARSNEVDIEFHRMLKELQNNATNSNETINESIEEAVSDSEERDAQLDAKIEAETNRARTEENRIESKINTLADEVDSEKTRAKAAEEILTNSLAAANSQLSTLNDAFNTEKQRSADKDLEHTNALNAETSRATAKENEIATNLATEIARATDIESHINEDLHNEITRAKAEEARIEALIVTNNGKDNELEDRVDDLESDIATVTGNLTSEIARAKQVESDITSSVQTLKQSYLETQAKAVANETAINVLNGDESVVGSVAHSLADSKHYTDDKVAALTAETASIDTQIEEINAALTGKANKTDVYTKAEVNAKETAIISDLAAEVTRATNAETTIANNVSTNATNIAAEVGRATAKEAELEGSINELDNDINTLNGYLNNEITRATNAEETLTNTISNVSGNLTAEVARAKAAEGDLATEINQLKTAVNEKNTENNTALTTLQNDLSAEITRAKNAEQTNAQTIANVAANAESYTDRVNAETVSLINSNIENKLEDYAKTSEVDSRIEGIIGTAPAAFDTLGEIAEQLSKDNDAITAINAVLTGKPNASDVYTKAEVNTIVTDLSNDLSTEVSRAKSAERTNADAIAVLTGDENQIGSVRHAEENAKSYTDEEVAKLNTNVDNRLSTLATKTEVEAVRNEIPTKVSQLQNDNGYLTEHQSLDGYYTKAEVDAKESAINTALTAEIGRATNAETQAADALAIINGESDVIGSIKHGVADSKHYTDDKIAALKAVVDADAVAYARKSEIPTKVSELLNDSGYLTEHQSLANYYNKTQTDNKIAEALAGVNMDNYYTKPEINAKVAQLQEAIENVDVTDQLQDYAKIAETTVIKDNNDNVITTMVVDNSANDNTIEVYTKAQCDSRFALKNSGSQPTFWSGTQAQFDAITTKDNNTIYFVYE